MGQLSCVFDAHYLYRRDDLSLLDDRKQSRSPETLEYDAILTSLTKGRKEEESRMRTFKVWVPKREERGGDSITLLRAFGFQLDPLLETETHYCVVGCDDPDVGHSTASADQQKMGMLEGFWYNTNGARQSPMICVIYEDHVYFLETTPRPFGPPEPAC